MKNKGSGMNILPNVGISDLAFFISKEQAMEHLGKPESMYKYTDGSGRESLSFYKAGLDLLLTESGVIGITIENIERNLSARLWDIEVFTLNSSQIILLAQNNACEFTKTEDEFGIESISIKHAGLNFYFDEDKLTSLEVYDLGATGTILSSH